MDYIIIYSYIVVYSKNFHCEDYDKNNLSFWTVFQAQEFMKWLGMELYKLKWSTKEYLECQKSPKVHYFSKNFKYFQNFGSLNSEATPQKSSLF